MFGKPPPSPSLNHAVSHFLPATPPPERHSFCLLCGQRFLKKNIKLLALHLQQQHPYKFAQAMDGFFDMEKLMEEKQVKRLFSSFKNNIEAFYFRCLIIITSLESLLRTI